MFGTFLEYSPGKYRIKNERKKLVSLKITKRATGAPYYEVKSRDLNGRSQFFLTVNYINL